MVKSDHIFHAYRCSTVKAHGAEHMPGQSTRGRQEGQAGEMRVIGGLRPPKPAPHRAIMFHYRIAAMGVCVGALVARLTLVGVEFRRDSDAIFAPDEIWVRIDCTAHRLLTDAARMREREPGVTHHDVMRNPVIHCIQRGWTAVGGVRCSINRTIGYFKHCNSPQAATASDVAVLFSISFRRSSP